MAEMEQEEAKEMRTKETIDGFKLGYNTGKEEALEEVEKIIDDLRNREYDLATLDLLEHLIELQKIKELEDEN